MCGSLRLLLFFNFTPPSLFFPFVLVIVPFLVFSLCLPLAFVLRIFTSFSCYSRLFRSLYTLLLYEFPVVVSLHHLILVSFVFFLVLAHFFAFAIRFPLCPPVAVLSYLEFVVFL